MNREDNMRLKDKVCIITGAGSGLGRGAAERFAREGAKLALNDINEKSLKETVKSIQNKAIILDGGDASDENVAVKLVKKTISKWGRIDVLFANAGRVYICDITDMSLDLWNEIIKNNMTSMFVWVKAVLPQMLKQKKGSIITMSSMSAFVGQEFKGTSTWAYNITKAAALQAARSLATRYGKYGIRVNAICPGHIRTDILKHGYGLGKLADEEVTEIYNGIRKTVPVGRECTIEELINGVVFLASDESSYMTGQGLVIDGGAIIKG